MTSALTPAILQVLPEMRSGGVERGTVEIGRAIARQGWRSLVASSGGPMSAGLKHHQVQHVELPLKSKNPFTIYRNIGRLSKLIRQEKVSLIHARSRAPAWSAYYAAKRCGIPFVTTFHGIYNFEGDKKKHYNSIMTRGDRVIAISEFTANHIRENYQVPEEKLRIIPRGVDLNHFNPLKVSGHAMAELSRQWNVPEHLPVILMPGRLTRWKGQRFLIDALATLPHRNFFCVIVGDDKDHSDYRSELETHIRQSGLEGHVRMVGHTSHMPEAYMLSQVVVMPSLEPEAFGRVAMEAQAMARPVIATNHGGAAETVLHHETGWLVTPGNVQELAGALLEATSLTREQFHEVGLRAMQHAAEHYDLTLMQQRTLAVYAELLGIELLEISL